ncbi:PAS and ANTAR domain-containing protein [Nocardia sp. AG03]|uniref:PAS and ANTAR domain-containing protein n=1 Tax=Nocardia sp. AG03 TaxID=3025312 RepID=UPI002418248D|nr:PAS and ANTAR domain-containing protein [Nocardia sp. AG03]
MDQELLGESPVESSVSPSGAAEVEAVIGTGTQQPIGSFRFWFGEKRWEWSDEVAAMHGYAPGQVEPTTELLLSHQHPDDRDRVAGAITTMIENSEPFSSRHRIIDTAGFEHEVIAVTDLIHDDHDAVIGILGYYIEITDLVDDGTDQEGAESYEGRQTIEQAKGALMLIYGLTSDQAFRLLRWRSQESNVRLRALATQLVAELRPISKEIPQFRNRFDHRLLTLHERVPEH